MKQLVIVLLLLITVSTQAQDKRFTAYTFGHPAHNDGFNIGIGIEYQMTIMYFKAQAYFFPQLRGIDYAEYVGSIGLNLHSFNDTVRVFGGVKAGSIRRTGPFPTYGFEAGIEYYIPNTSLYIGYMTAYTYREDGKVWENNAQEYWTYSNFLKIGIQW